MRLLPVLLLARALAAPAAAPAQLIAGGYDNRPAMLADPLFAELGAKRVRLVVSWDAMAAQARGDNEITDRVAPYIAAADAKGVEVMVAVDHTRGSAGNCASSTKGTCRLPS